MLIKTIIVLLFLANVVVLGRALQTMMEDQGKRSNRTARMLLIRVSLAVVLLAVIAYGMVTGQLSSSAPWLRYAESHPEQNR